MRKNKILFKNLRYKILNNIIYGNIGKKNIFS